MPMGRGTSRRHRWAACAALALLAVAAFLLFFSSRPAGDPSPSLPAPADPARLGAILQAREYARAEEEALASLAQRPDDLEALAALGIARGHGGRPDLAEEPLRRALALASGAKRNAVRIELAIALEKLGRLREGIAEAAAVLIDDPYDRQGYLRVGRGFARLGRGEEGESFFGIARALAPGECDARRSMGYVDTGEGELAARFRARGLARHGRFAEGERILRAAAARGSAGARVYLAEYLIETLRLREAREVLAALGEELGPSHPDVRGWRAMALRREGRAHAAASLLAAMCNEVPHVVPIWAPRLASILLEDLGLPEEARLWLELFFRRGPDVRARVLLARALFAEGDPARAFEVLESITPAARAAVEGEGEILLARARIRMRRDFDGIGPALAAIADRSPHVPEVWLAIAEWIEAGGDPRRVPADPRRASERLAALEGSVRRLVVLAARAGGREASGHLCEAAETRLRMGDRAEAVRTARLACAIAPGDAQPWRLIEMWLDRPGEVFLREEARRELARIDPASGSAPRSADEIVAAWRIEDAAAPAHRTETVPALRREESTAPIAFADVADRCGIDFACVCGGAEKDYLVEVNGGGAAIFDYDGDGLLDVYLVNASRLAPPHGEGAGDPPPSDRLYRNAGGFRFRDVTEEAGLIEAGWGCGVAIGDIDGDGDPDIFVSQYGPDRLWRNEGDGTFTDVTEAAGAGDPRWGASCAFLDYDRDGFLDLFIVNYLGFDPREVPRRGRDPMCTYRGAAIACGPAGLPPVPCTLLRNRGDGTFEDASERSGIRDVDLASASYGLGVAVLDVDGDDLLDIYVSNDTRPNLLFRNRGDGTFEEIGMRAGVALDDDGVAQAGMGVDAVFLGDRDREDLFVVNFEDDGNTYYRNLRDGFFEEASGAKGLTESGFATLGWGTSFFDPDLDGDLDLFIANGHVAPQADGIEGSPGYRQRNLFLRNDGAGRFEDASDRAGPGLLVAKSSRGAAFGDLDGDGDADIVINDMDERATVLENGGAPANHWLAARIRGTRSNRDGIGAVVILEAGGRTARRRMRSGSSYASQSEPLARFGLGRADAVEAVRVRWPSGEEEVFDVPGVDRVVDLVEGRGRQPSAPSQQ